MSALVRCLAVAVTFTVAALACDHTVHEPEPIGRACRSLAGKCSCSGWEEPGYGTCAPEDLPDPARCCESTSTTFKISGSDCACVSVGCNDFGSRCSCGTPGQDGYGSLYSCPPDRGICCVTVLGEAHCECSKTTTSCPSYGYQVATCDVSVVLGYECNDVYFGDSSLDSDDTLVAVDSCTP